MMNQLGIAAEEYVTEYLVSQKYEILVRNFRFKYGGIDIIAIKDDQIICVEVKSSCTDMYGSPGLRVNSTKLLRIQKCYESFLVKFSQYREHSCRIDVVSVVISKQGKIRLVHYKNVRFEDMGER